MINIVLYEPEIPQNTGNIMRTCAGTGTHLHLIRPLGFSLDEKSIKRCGVNYIENCHYTIYDNFKEFKEKNDGEFFYLTRYRKKAHSDFDYTKIKKDIYLVLGKESTGIPKEILKEHLDRCFRIPMNTNIRALNVANSAAIALFEVLRQLDYPNLSRTEVFKGEDYLEQ